MCRGCVRVCVVFNSDTFIEYVAMLIYFRLEYFGLVCIKNKYFCCQS
jgi:hypothetical protein